MKLYKSWNINGKSILILMYYLYCKYHNMSNIVTIKCGMEYATESKLLLVYFIRYLFYINAQNLEVK